jgi:hypothetical protein
VYGEFLVNSTSVNMLFDSSALHSFVSTCFVLKNSLRIVLHPNPLLIRTPRAILKCTLKCPRVKIMINGVEFQADLVVLKTEGLNIILGMDWLKRHHGNISCSNIAVTLTNHNGITVKCSLKPRQQNQWFAVYKQQLLKKYQSYVSTSMCSLKSYPEYH